MKKRLLSLLLALTMIVGMIPFGAFPLFAEGTDGPCLSHSDGDSDGLCDVCGAVKYYDWNGTDEELKENWLTAEPVVISGSSDDLTLAEGWYYVSGDAEITNRVSVTGDARLILGNGKTLTADLGIGIDGADSDLSIYAQSLDEDEMGTLTVSGTGDDGAVIGSNSETSCGDITISGGKITVTGKTIGGAMIGSGSDGDCGNIAVNGGVLLLSARTSGGAGIGSGDLASCGNITISGGILDFTGCKTGGGSEIGSGRDGKCGNITISGGKINAVGDTGRGPAIGCGYNSAHDLLEETDIFSECGTITVDGGRIIAIGNDDGAGIGCGRYGKCGDITISGGIIEAVGGEYAQPIGNGKNSASITVNYANGIFHKYVNNTVYVSDSFAPGEDPTCVDSGYSVCFIGSDGQYYTDVFCEEDSLIGNEEAYEDWKAEAGYVPPLGHDYSVMLEQTHSCSRCESSASHVDSNGDGMCDACGSVKYYDWNSEEQAPVPKWLTVTPTVIDGSVTELIPSDENGGWFIVRDNVEVTYFSAGDGAKLILADNAVLSIVSSTGFRIDGSFSLYAQSTDAATMGRLSVTAPSMGQATDGIHCGLSAATFTVNGGILDVTVGKRGQAIGTVGTVNINSGIIKAVSGRTSTPIDAEENSVNYAEGIFHEIIPGTECSTEYVGLPLVFGVKPSCGTSGYSDAYIGTDGQYYSGFPRTEDNLIGDEEAYEAWKNDPEGGYIAPHGQHVDKDENNVCDECGAVKYYDWDDTDEELKENWISSEDVEVIGDPSEKIKLDELELTGGWYLIGGDVEVLDSIIVTEDAYLILGNGKTLTAELGIALDDWLYSAGRKDLTICAQSLDADAMGALIVPDSYGAGIGGEIGSFGKITINGGILNVRVGGESAGIGGSKDGTVAINGGVLKVTGGKDAQPIGNHRIGINVTVSYAEGLSHEIINGTEYVGCSFVPGTEPGCETPGRLAALIHPKNGKYYSDLPFSADTEISGGVYLAPLGHIDENRDGKCDRCEATADVTVNLHADTTYTCVVATGAKLTEVLNGLLAGSETFSAEVVRYLYADGETVGENDVITYGPEIYALLRYPAEENSCLTSGTLEYYENTLLESGEESTAAYFSDESCQNLIGGPDALSAWLGEGGDGYVAPFGHDWSASGTEKHRCLRCELTEPHTDGNGDGRCDVCGGSNLTFYDWNGTGLEEITDFVIYTEIGSPSAELTELEDLSLSAGWYLVCGNISVENRVRATGGVHLILADNVTFTADNGIGIYGEGSSLTVYARSLDKDTMGRLTVSGAEEENAGIGSDYESSCGDITINGGRFDVAGGEYAAGIGSGTDGRCGDITIRGGYFDTETIGGGSGGTCGNITIDGGYFEKVSGKDYCAGIGGGAECESITINGGYFEQVTGGKSCAGIGGGNGGHCGGITISGGVFENVTGGKFGAGIGGGSGEGGGTTSSCDSITILGGTLRASASGYYGAGIGSGSRGSCGNITISGGVIEAYGTDFGAGIGGGDHDVTCGTVYINGGYIKAAGTPALGNGDGDKYSAPEFAPGLYHENVGGTEYVGYLPIYGTEPGCETPGSKTVYSIPWYDKYYSSIPFTDAGWIGDEEDLIEWQNDPEGGYIAPLGHVDKDENNVCDVCGVVSYYAWDDDAKQLVLTWSPVVPTAIDTSSDDLALENDGEEHNGWYLISGEVEVTNRVGVSGDVHLILADGAVFTVSKGIGLEKDSSITFSAQSLDEDTMGKVSATEAERHNAAIGGTGNVVFNSITINGGVFDISGSTQHHALGSGTGGSCGNITINGGFINIARGMLGCGTDGSCDHITINGGVILNQRDGGIGCGTSGFCVDITINGGFIETVNRKNAAGIGSGSEGSCGSITISGGVIMATGGEGGAGIGSGTKGSCGSITISGGVIMAVGGEGAEAIGKGAESEAVTVSYKDVIHGSGANNTEYVGCVVLSRKEALCEESGYKEALIDPESGLYYSGFPFTEENLIGSVGSPEDYTEWKTPGRNGYLAPLGHLDENTDGICDRCETVFDVTVTFFADKSKSFTGVFASGTKLSEILDGWLASDPIDPSAELVKIVYSGSRDYRETDIVPVTEGDSITLYAILRYPAAVPATCVNGGYKDYYESTLARETGGEDAAYYFSNAKCTDAIGGPDELAVWLTEEGGGYVPAFGHDWKIDIEGVVHHCLRCGLDEEHIDENSDKICDVCGAQEVTFYDWNAEEGKLEEVSRMVNLTIIKDESDLAAITLERLYFSEGWYLIGNWVRALDVKVYDNVRLILEDGAYLKAENGIRLNKDASFTIYAQSLDPDTAGELYGVGGISGESGRTAGDITINGGCINFKGGTFNAAIGGRCGDITINGGTLVLDGGDYAGIGSGNDKAPCGNITINGGDLSIWAGYSGAGIGSGTQSCGDITINGGKITAQGGNYGGAGIGSGPNSSGCGTVTINGGMITAQGRQTAEHIGAGSGSPSVTVIYAEGMLHEIVDGQEYVMPGIAGTEPDCLTSGCKAAYLNPEDGLYYSVRSFAEDGLIGDKAAAEAWQTDPAGGYLAPLGHDWSTPANLNSHQCLRCGLSGAHSDEDGNRQCDVCGTVYYYEWNTITEKPQEKAIAERAFETIGDPDESTELAGLALTAGWYYLTGDVEVTNRITVDGDVHLILGNGKTLTADQGVGLGDGSHLYIHAQSLLMGTMGALVVPGAPDGCAGIGGNNEKTGGTITIDGGCFNVTGGANAAAIGCGYQSRNIYVTINGGILDVTGGANSPAIGGSAGSTCDSITINGGYIKAVPGKNVSRGIFKFIEITCPDPDMDIFPLMIDGAQYIGYRPADGKMNDCVTSGYLPAYEKVDSDVYYASLPFDETERIGDSAALAVWRSDPEGGYLAPLGHLDENSDGVCERCCSASYYDWDGSSSRLVPARSPAVTVIDSSSDGLALINDGGEHNGWYIVIGSVEIKNRITVTGGVRLILGDGAVLKADQGIGIGESSSLTIYAQSLDKATMGKLTVPGAPNACAGIGSGSESTCGAITINGGCFNIRGGFNGAGIGSGFNGGCGIITIRGGDFDVAGGYQGAGIGSGLGAGCGNITLSGGDIRATGGDQAAAIGSGYSSGCSDITIGGGNIRANGGGSSSGIGCGMYSSCGKITIGGGTILTTGGSDGAGIGGGVYANALDLITINGGKIKAVGSSPAPAIGGSYSDPGYAEYAEGVIHGNGPNVNTVYVGVSYLPEKAALCEEPGNKASVYDPESGLYYPDFPLNEENLIGNAEAYAAWKSSGGKGHLAPLGHLDKNSDGVCERCGESILDDGVIFEFDACDLALESDLAFRFKGYVSDGVSEDAYMEFAIGDIRTEKVMLAGLTQDAKGRYVFICHLNVLEVSEKITAVFHSGEETVNCTETAVSLENYLDEVEVKYPDTAAVVGALRDYAHYAQAALDESHTGYTVGNKAEGSTYAATEAKTAELAPAGAETLKAFKAVRKTAQEYTAVTSTSRSLVLDDRTAIVIYLTLADSDDVPEITVTDGDGAEAEFTVTAQKNNTCRVVIPEIAASMLGSSFTVRIDGGQEAGGMTFTGLSALSYAYTILSSAQSSDNYRLAVTALYNYYTAATAYAASK